VKTSPWSATRFLDLTKLTAGLDLHRASWISLWANLRL
jgi:hypothetical protein